MLYVVMQHGLVEVDKRCGVAKPPHVEDSAGHDHIGKALAISNRIMVTTLLLLQVLLMSWAR